MKIGNREFTSFKDTIEQFQMFAINHPWLAAVDVAIVGAIIVAVEVFSGSY